MTNSIQTLLLTDQSVAKVGEKVVVKGEENGVEFEHFGVVLNFNDTNVTLQSVYGEMTINPNVDNISVHIGDLPLIVRDVEIDNYKTETKKTGLRNGSKQQLVVDMMLKNPNLERKDYINMIVEQFGMSKAGASTYHQNAKKHI